MFMQLHDNRITALYCRLIREDDGVFQENSCSIESQKTMLWDHVERLGLGNREYFIDDGYSGTNFERPDFKRMLNMIENNQVGTLIVKDLSRLGREYLKTGYYTEIFFPSHDVRFIAINDGVDSLDGDNEFAPFRNICNEMMSRDISRKTKSSMRVRVSKGEYVNGNPPYGYMRDPSKKNHLIPDENTAPTVKTMFCLALEGKTPYAIAMFLQKSEKPKPTAYVRDDDGGYHLNERIEYPFDWNSKTVSDILANNTYIGTLCVGMTTHRSFKDKRVARLP